MTISSGSLAVEVITIQYLDENGNWNTNSVVQNNNSWMITDALKSLSRDRGSKTRAIDSSGRIVDFYQ